MFAALFPRFPPGGSSPAPHANPALLEVLETPLPPFQMVASLWTLFLGPALLTLIGFPLLRHADRSLYLLREWKPGAVEGAR